MILKIMIFATLIAVIYFKFFKKPLARKPSQDIKKKSKDKSEEIMVECKECGTYISNTEAIIKDGDYYCSQECVKAS